MRITSRRIVQATAALAAAAMMAACSSSAASESEQEEGGTLTYLEFDAHTTLYPPEGGKYQNGGIINNIGDRLVYQDPETLDFEPWLATEWEVNDDATEFTFTLREDVTFSDGAPLTAEVVAANFDLYGQGDSGRALIVSEAVNNYESSEVIDEHTVRFHFTDPSPGFLQATSTINSAILSPDTIEFAHEGFGPGNAVNVIGTGPFVIDSEDIGTSLTLTAREDYDWAPASHPHQGRAQIDEIQIQVLPEDSVRIGALTSGQGHIARQIGAKDEQRVRDAGAEIVAAATRGVNNSLNYRIGSDILSDERVRQAISAAVDREEVVETIFTDSYPLATGVLASSALGYLDTSQSYSHDPEAARDLLEEAGWEEGADGIREKDGERLTLVVNEAAPQPRSFDVVTLLSQQLREVGIDLEVLRADAGTFAEAIKDPNRVQIYHSMVGRTDLDVIKSQFHSENRNVLLNRDPATGEITDPELEELLEAVASEADGEARVENSQVVQDYLTDNTYVLPLFEEPQVFGVNPGVEGFDTESVGRPSFYGVSLDG
ncbi:MAG TPA: TIGR04028 family ABC transporter substrate-binding protein [Beutenbergiaceae bacterium]|nr:TIGR04028 family ABC transporter substrate-binding protein [Beutenbergiaceae bacterium]